MKKLITILMLITSVCYSQTMYESNVSKLWEWNGETYKLEKKEDIKVVVSVHKEYIVVILNREEIFQTWWILIPECDEAFDCYITEGDLSKVCIFYDRKSIIFWTRSNGAGRFTRGLEMVDIKEYTDKQ